MSISKLSSLDSGHFEQHFQRLMELTGVRAAKRTPIVELILVKIYSYYWRFLQQVVFHLLRDIVLLD